MYIVVLPQFICMALLFKPMGNCSSGSMHRLRFICSCPAVSLCPGLSWMISHAVLLTPHHDHVQKLLLFLIYRELGLWPKFFPSKLVFPTSTSSIPRAGIIRPLVQMSLKPTGPQARWWLRI